MNNKLKVACLAGLIAFYGCVSKSQKNNQDGKPKPTPELNESKQSADTTRSGKLMGVGITDSYIDDSKENPHVDIPIPGKYLFAGVCESVENDILPDSTRRPVYGVTISENKDGSVSMQFFELAEGMTRAEITGEETLTFQEFEEARKIAQKNLENTNNKINPSSVLFRSHSR